MVASIVCQLFDHCEQTSVSNDSANAKSSSSENDGQTEEESVSLIQSLINWLKGIFTSKPYKSLKINPVNTSTDAEEERPEPFGILPNSTKSR